MEKDYTLAKHVQFNNKAEAEAIEYYTDFLSIVEQSLLPADEKEKIIAVIKEIIADELNHQDRLYEMYVSLSKIEANED